MPDYLELTIHRFKTHLSRTVTLLEQGKYKAVIVKRHRKPVGLFMLIDRPKPALLPAEDVGLVRNYGLGPTDPV